MSERPYSRYTRAKTWAALYSQHLTAGYALVPWSTTNNSIAVISCKDAKNPTQDLAKDTQDMVNRLLQDADACADYYSRWETPDEEEQQRPEASKLLLAQKHQEITPMNDGIPQPPAILAEAIHAKKLRSAVVLARSSDYHHYHLEDYPGFTLLICGQHDSYVHLPVWEMRTNRRYKARETAVAISSPEFDSIRRTQFGHRILIAAYAQGDEAATTFVENARLPERTRSRFKREKEELQAVHYRGRPLAFLTEAKRREIGDKISQGLKRYHAQKYLQVV